MGFRYLLNAQQNVIETEATVILVCYRGCLRNDVKDLLYSKRVKQIAGIERGIVPLGFLIFVKRLLS